MAFERSDSRRQERPQADNIDRNQLLKEGNVGRVERTGKNEGITHLELDAAAIYPKETSARDGVSAQRARTGRIVWVDTSYNGTEKTGGNNQPYATHERTGKGQLDHSKTWEDLRRLMDDFLKSWQGAIGDADGDGRLDFQFSKFLLSFRSAIERDFPASRPEPSFAQSAATDRAPQAREATPAPQASDSSVSVTRTVSSGLEPFRPNRKGVIREFFDNFQNAPNLVKEDVYRYSGTGPEPGEVSHVSKPGDPSGALRMVLKKETVHHNNSAHNQLNPLAFRKFDFGKSYAMGFDITQEGRDKAEENIMQLFTGGTPSVALNARDGKYRFTVRQKTIWEGDYTVGKADRFELVIKPTRPQDKGGFAQLYRNGKLVADHIGWTDNPFNNRDGQLRTHVTPWIGPYKCSFIPGSKNESWERQRAIVLDNFFMREIDSKVYRPGA